MVTTCIVIVMTFKHKFKLFVMIHSFSEHAAKQNRASRVNLTSIYNGDNTIFQWIEMTERFINWNKQKLIS